MCWFGCAKCMLIVGLIVALNAVARDSVAEGLVPVGTQPHGGLSGKIVYTHGGHGFTAANESDGAWTPRADPGME